MRGEGGWRRRRIAAEEAIVEEGGADHRQGDGG